MYKNPVCRGSWALGSACKRCERCIATRPGVADSAEVVRLFDVLPEIDIKPGGINHTLRPVFDGPGDGVLEVEHNPVPDLNRAELQLLRQRIANLEAGMTVAIRNLNSSELRLLPSVAHVIRSLQEARDHG